MKNTTSLGSQLQGYKDILVQFCFTIIKISYNSYHCSALCGKWSVLYSVCFVKKGI